MKVLAFFVVFIISLSTSFARLGETPEQIKARYGQPFFVDKEKQLVMFTKGEWQIAAQFLNGICHCIMYQKIPGEFNISEKISDTEIETLLKANGGGKEWKEVHIIAAQKQWATDGMEKVAMYDPIERQCIIMTKEIADKHAADKAQKEAKALDGF